MSCRALTNSLCQKTSELNHIFAEILIKRICHKDKYMNKQQRMNEIYSLKNPFFVLLN